MNRGAFIMQALAPDRKPARRRQLFPAVPIP